MRKYREKKKEKEEKEPAMQHRNQTTKREKKGKMAITEEKVQV